MATLEQAREWVAKNVDPLDVPDVDAALIWFEANNQAEDMRDYNQRELAEAIAGGMTPLTIEEVAENWVDWPVEDMEATFEVWFNVKSPKEPT